MCGGHGPCAARTTRNHCDDRRCTSRPSISGALAYAESSTHWMTPPGANGYWHVALGHHLDFVLGAHAPRYAGFPRPSPLKQRQDARPPPAQPPPAQPPLPRSACPRAALFCWLVQQPQLNRQSEPAPSRLLHRHWPCRTWHMVCTRPTAAGARNKCTPPPISCASRSSHAMTFSWNEHVQYDRFCVD